MRSTNVRDRLRNNGAVVAQAAARHVVDEIAQRSDEKLAPICDLWQRRYNGRCVLLRSASVCAGHCRVDKSIVGQPLQDTCRIEPRCSAKVDM